MRVFKFTLFIFLAVSAFSTRSQAQVVFLEDFDNIAGPTAGGPGTYTFAPGFLLRNVDNRTPDAQVSYVNEAWERREDFGFNVVDSVAFSTSYYAPIGPANDWMWTPVIGPLPANTTLSWNARSYDPLFLESYEVRVMVAPTVPTGGTGVIGNQITNSTVVFSTAASPAALTTQTVPLNAYTGQSIYIGFRNNSNDKFLLTIDDIKVEVLLNHDAQVVGTDTVTGYTEIPRSQVHPLNFGGSVRNSGLQNITNVNLNVEVRDGSNAVVHTAAGTAVSNLAPNATTNIVIAPWTPPAVTGTYTYRIYSSIAETDQLPANDTVTGTFIISDTTYARDNGIISANLGIGAGNGGYLGQDFLVVNAGRLSTVGVFYARGYAGRKFSVAIWDMAGGVPNAIVAVSDTLIYPDDSARFYILPMQGGSFNIAPGMYAVTAVEHDSTLAIGQTNNIFTLNTTWVDWPTNPLAGWANNEDFGPSFSKPYVIRPNFLEPCPPAVGTLASSDPLCATDSGQASVTTIAGTAPYTYLWSNGATSSSVNAGSGVLTVTVTDATGCATALGPVTITVPAAVLVSASSTDATCGTCNDGSATANASGGTGALAYSWAPSGGTSSTATGLAPGTYTVTVTDANGCTQTASAVVEDSETVGLDENTKKDVITIFPNPSDGNFSFTANIGFTGKAAIDIIDGTGKTVMTKNITLANSFTANNTVNITGVASGNYMIRLTAGKQTYIRKLVVQ